MVSKYTVVAAFFMTVFFAGSTASAEHKPHRIGGTIAVTPIIWPNQKIGARTPLQISKTETSGMFREIGRKLAHGSYEDTSEGLEILSRTQFAPETFLDSQAAGAVRRALNSAMSVSLDSPFPELRKKAFDALSQFLQRATYVRAAGDSYSVGMMYQDLKWGLPTYATVKDAMNSTLHPLDKVIRIHPGNLPELTADAEGAAIAISRRFARNAGMMAKLGARAGQAVDYLPAAIQIGGHIVLIAGLTSAAIHAHIDGMDARRHGRSYAGHAACTAIDDVAFNICSSMVLVAHSQKYVNQGFEKLSKDPSVEGSVLWNKTHDSSGKNSPLASLVRSQEEERKATIESALSAGAN